jgi:6-phosphogluconolactonase
VLVPNTNADKILQFTFDAATGQLQPNTPAQVTTPAGEGPRHLVFHPDGDHVYVVNEHADSVTTFAYDAGSGTLSALGTVSTLPPGANGATNTCADIHVSDDGRFVYASNRGHDSLAIFSVDPQDKSLTPVGHQMTEPIPREFELALGGRYLYAAGQNSDQLAAYEADPGTGLLTPIDVYPVGDAPLWVLWVAVPAP